MPDLFGEIEPGVAEVVPFDGGARAYSYSVPALLVCKQLQLLADLEQLFLLTTFVQHLQMKFDQWVQHLLS